MSSSTFLAPALLVPALTLVFAGIGIVTTALLLHWGEPPAMRLLPLAGACVIAGIGLALLWLLTEWLLHRRQTSRK